MKLKYKNSNSIRIKEFYVTEEAITLKHRITPNFVIKLKLITLNLILLASIYLLLSLIKLTFNEKM